MIAMLLVTPQLGLGQGPIAFQYFYDDLNQLVKVIDSTGVTIQYVYDAVGNLQQIVRSNTGQSVLAIFNFTPQTVPISGTVTIQGQGFSTTPSANVVKFNDVAVTVVSATENIKDDGRIQIHSRVSHREES